jgi:hypothetical protein
MQSLYLPEKKEEMGGGWGGSNFNDSKKAWTSLLILIPCGDLLLMCSQILYLKRVMGVDKIKMSHDKLTNPVVN